MKKLSSCCKGDVVSVVRIGGTGIIRKRLLEMGLMKGTRLVVVKYAPLRDPLEIAVGDCHVSLRVSEAETIVVGPANDSSLLSSGNNGREKTP